MNESYLTVSNTACDEIVIQKSRFIGYAAPCNTEEEAHLFIQKIREKHRDARHHCYAYVIGLNSGIMRYSDDGEPGGTSGMPIMDVLKNEHIVNCCVVVVRYFGGILLGTGGLVKAYGNGAILLGTGGLVRAYTQGCKIALQAANIVRMELSVLQRCRVSYAAWNQIQYSLQKLPVQLNSVDYSDMIEFQLCSRLSDLNETVRILNDLTVGKIIWMDSEEKYMPWSNQEP